MTISRGEEALRGAGKGGFRFVQKPEVRCFLGQSNCLFWSPSSPLFLPVHRLEFYWRHVVDGGVDPLSVVVRNVFRDFFSGGKPVLVFDHF